MIDQVVSAASGGTAKQQSDSMFDASIVIPTFNRWDVLSQTLDSLCRVDYPNSRWEVVVVDDGSTEQAGPRVAEWIQASPINVRFIVQQNSGPAGARNRGAVEARGKNLIFIDNDIVVEPSFLREHLEALSENPGCWILGRVIHPPELRLSPFGRYRDTLFEAFSACHPVDRVSDTVGMSTQNVSMPLADFRRLGGFDERFTIASCEDLELALRARHSGIRVLYNPRIIVLHNDWAISLDRFCERQRLYSISDVLLSQKYGESSPRARLVRENSPIEWAADPLPLIIKKAVKRALATRIGRAVVHQACLVTERVTPDSRLCRGAYDLAVGVAIFRGVREGLTRYCSAGLEPGEHNRVAARSQVCHLTDQNVGTNYFRSIARHHDHDRFPVMIGSVAPAGQLQESTRKLGATTFSLGATARWQYPFAILRLVRLLRRERAAVLHAHCFDSTLVGLIAARLAGISFVFTRHHSDHNIRLGKRSHTRIDSWCARHADHVIAVSEATRKIMTDIESVPENQISVVHNGMEPVVVPATENVERVRLELGLSDEPVCLMVARLHEEKGHRVLFDAIPEIISRVGRVVFLLAGDGPERAELEAEVRGRGLEGVVRFLGQREDVAELISLSSVMVLPSLAESFGFAPLEAMSLGIPVVAAATGGIPEVVADGETGLIVPKADPTALAHAICRVVQDPDLARALGTSGRRRAKLFGFEQMIRGYEKVYVRITTSPRELERQLCDV